MVKLNKSKNDALKAKLKMKLPAQVVDTIFDIKNEHKDNVKKLIEYLRTGK